jgi:competence protein ComEA
VLNHWTDREKWFLGLLMFLLFLMFSFIVYFNMEDEQALENPFPEMKISVHDVDKPLAMEGGNAWDGWSGDNDKTSSPNSTSDEMSRGEAVAMIVVDVKGEVINPGVFSIPAGSRIDDAITEAGGTTAQADLTMINLAERLTDGSAIWIPETTPSSAAPASGQTAKSPVRSGVISAPQQQKAKDKGTSSAIININSASMEQLMELPGIGEAKATAIIEYREQHGPFKKIEDLMEVGGIGPKVLENMRDHISLD